MNKHVIDTDDRPGHGEDTVIRAQACGDDKQQGFTGGFNEAFRRMEACGGKPVHLFRAVVDGMKRPDFARVKNPVPDINQNIAHKKIEQKLTDPLPGGEAGIPQL